MKTLVVVAWRNVWRTPSRSAIIIAAIALGLLGGNLIAAISTGLLNQSSVETIRHRVSHIQMHNPDFIANPEPQHGIENGRDIFRQVRERDGVRAAAARLAFDGMVASATMSSGVRIVGVDPPSESTTTRMNARIEEGTYFADPGRLPPVVVGRELAEKLRSGVGSRIVLTFQDVDGELISASFRVGGIFSLNSRAFEERNLFVLKNDLAGLAGAPGGVTEIAVLLEDDGRYREVAAEMQESFPHAEVRTWEELAPDLYFQHEMVGQSLMWVIAIILMGASFGILNTILMSVFERTRELGVLMSIGMKKAAVFKMILLETTMLAVVGGAAGLAISFGAVKYLSRRGIDLTAVGGENLRELGFSPEIHPDLAPAFYLQVAVMVGVFAVLAAIYPAFKAIKLLPAEAVRKE